MLRSTHKFIISCKILEIFQVQRLIEIFSASIESEAKMFEWIIKNAYFMNKKKKSFSSSMVE